MDITDLKCYPPTYSPDIGKFYTIVHGYVSASPARTGLHGALPPGYNTYHQS